MEDNKWESKFDEGFVWSEAAPGIFCMFRRLNEADNEQYNKAMPDHLKLDFKDTLSIAKPEYFKAFIKEAVAEATHCNKPVENGKAICGCKLDCHLHDWRQNEAVAAERERIVEIIENMPSSEHHEVYDFRKDILDTIHSIKQEK